MEKHKNLSIFVPHEGCPNKCSFCDQNKISGTEAPPSPRQVARLCDEFLPHSAEEGRYYEIAFFGGSFTAIERCYMLRLLQAAYPFVQRGRASGIRCSTRPDAIDTEILQILKQYGVTSIELGAQSMDDQVLKVNLRGHTAQDVVNASQLIKSAGFSLGLQMMPGLYGRRDYTADAISTAQQFIDLQPDTVRIYPTLTLKDTLLATLFQNGDYTPLTLDEAVQISAQLVPMFEANDIKVIKLGLHSDTGLEQSLVAGPYHQAFKELVQSHIYLEKVKKELQQMPQGSYVLQVNRKKHSQFAGQKKANINALAQLGYTVKIEDNDLLIDDQYIIFKEEVKQCI